MNEVPFTSSTLLKTSATSDFMILAFSFAISPFASFNSWPKIATRSTTVSNWIALTSPATCFNKFS